MPQSLRRPRVTATVAIALSTAGLVGALAGCGSSDATDEGAVTPSTGRQGPGPRTTTPSRGGFPLSISRTGGVAGKQDTVVISGTGQVQRVLAGRESRCTLDPAAFTALRDAAAGLGGQTAEVTPAHPDDLVVVLSSASGSARVEDLTEVDVSGTVTALLGDASPAQNAAVCH